MVCNGGLWLIWGSWGLWGLWSFVGFIGLSDFYSYLKIQDRPGPPRPTAIKIIIGTGEAILTAIGAPPRMLRPLPGDTFPSFLTASAQPPEAAPVLEARPAFWPGQDPRSSQDQPGPPRPTAIRIIIGTGEAILTAIGAPPRARWFPLGGMQRAMPGLLISSRFLAPTRPPGPCTAA